MTHSNFNDAIRRAAGRGSYTPPSEPDAPVKVGDIAVGRGAGSAPPRPPSTSERFNRELRAAFGIVRGRITLDELWR
jgi:hypothetical protein